MEEWRRLAETMPGTLFRVAYRATAAGGLLHRVAALHADFSPPAADVDSPDPLSGSFPSVSRDITRLRRLHADASLAFVLAGAALGLDHGPVWEMWRDRRAETFRCFAAARRRLRAARHLAQVFVAVYVVAWAFPHDSPECLLWMAHAQRFATRTAVTLAMLFHASRRLRDAAAGEFIAARTVLNWDMM